MRYLVVAVLLTIPAAPRAETWSGKAVAVSEGDTLTVARAERIAAKVKPGKAKKDQATPDKAKKSKAKPKKPAVRVTRIELRLKGIDAPEPRQTFGTKATRFTRRMVLGKQVRVVESPAARNRPKLAMVYVRGKCLNEELVRAGLAWHDGRPKNDRLASLQAAAKRARRGLWALANPVAPWSWRKKRPNVSSSRLLSIAGTLRGDTAAKVFHAPGCKSYRCASCSALFRSPSHAKRAGFRRHDCVKKRRASVMRAPRRKRGKHRRCKRDADCALLPTAPCGCPKCGTVWREAVNNARLSAWRKNWAALGCKKACRPKCATHYLGNVARCIKRQCTTRHE